jgi:DNA-directed RNA polymerase subunit RPC12/RpoP
MCAYICLHHGIYNGRGVDLRCQACVRCKHDWKPDETYEYWHCIKCGLQRFMKAKSK